MEKGYFASTVELRFGKQHSVVRIVGGRGMTFVVNDRGCSLCGLYTRRNPSDRRHRMDGQWAIGTKQEFSRTYFAICAILRGHPLNLRSNPRRGRRRAGLPSRKC